MVAGVEKKTNKWPKAVDNDKEFSENEKPVRDLLKFRTCCLYCAVVLGENIFMKLDC
ncbi:hypothetical protein FOXYSP1_17337 [Fusarium oxysporum f. sp. phaseoli]